MQRASMLRLILALSAIGTCSVLAETPGTHIETQISPSFTSIWVPPASSEASQTNWTFTITPKPNGATEGRVQGVHPRELVFFGPGLSQYFYAAADIQGVGRAEFGVLRAFAYAGALVFPKLYGPGFVQGTNPWAAIARAVVRPQFTDTFVPPPTAGAPNAGDTQTLTVQIVLDGVIGSEGSPSWLVRLLIFEEVARTPTYSAHFSTSGCGGPCPFPLATTPIDVATKVGTSYVILGDLGVTANASTSAGSLDGGIVRSVVDVANTGKFFVKVKETGAGIVGTSGHDYGATVPPGDLEIPTTTTLKLPPDTTTTTTLDGSSTTTTSLVSETTTTTLSAGSEQCDNCLDDDGDGRIDAEDVDCCTPGPLALVQKKVRMVTSASGALRLSATASDPATQGLDPTRAGLGVQLRDPATGPLFCARLLGTSFVRKKKGRVFELNGGAGSVQGLSQAVLRIGKQGAAFVLGGKAVSFDRASAIALEMTLAVDDATGRRCLVAPAVTLKRRKSTLRYP